MDSCTICIIMIIVNQEWTPLFWYQTLRSDHSEKVLHLTELLSLAVYEARSDLERIVTFWKIYFVAQCHVDRVHQARLKLSYLFVQDVVYIILVVICGREFIICKD